MNSNRSTLNKKTKYVDKKNAAAAREQQATTTDTMDTQSRRREFTRQYSDERPVMEGSNTLLLAAAAAAVEPTVVTRRWKWRCGYSSESWAKLFAVIDIVKGTFGLIFAAYLAISIFRLMAKTPDFQDLKRRMSRTEFVYLFAYGATSLGISLSVCGMALYHFLLIVFGKILFDAVQQRSTAKLRCWYVYAFISTVVFVGLYCRLIFAYLECNDLQLCQADHNSIVWLVAISYYLLSFVPSIYSIAIAQSLVNEISRQRRQDYIMERRFLALSQSFHSRSQSQSQFQGTATGTIQNNAAPATITTTQNNSHFSHSSNNIANSYDNYMTTEINYETKINYNPALHPRGFNL